MQFKGLQQENRRSDKQFANVNETNSRVKGHDWNRKKKGGERTQNYSFLLENAYYIKKHLKIHVVRLKMESKAITHLKMTKLLGI